jgi:hypothetical protein
MVATSSSDVNRIALIWSTLGLVGCFYTDPINQRPSISIHRESLAPVHRNDLVTLDAIAVDPDGDAVALQWRAYGCTQFACDADPFDTGTDAEFTTHIPTLRNDVSDELDSVHVVLEAHDSNGATAKPSQTLDLTLDDLAPALVLRKVARNGYVVNTSIDIYGQVSDPDDDASRITLSDPWLAEGPPAALTQNLIATHYMGEADQWTTSFTPTAIGDWTIDVTATDPSGLSDHELLPIHVDADHAPCLAQWDPTATSLPNTTIPITDPTLFQVLVVADDLDPYPSIPTPPIGTTTFNWSIVPPGGTRQALTGVTGAGVALDPDNYRPGDVVELRVEIQDRNHTPVNCPDTDLTCSVISDQSCLQRLTWRVEVR